MRTISLLITFISLVVTSATLAQTSPTGTKSIVAIALFKGRAMISVDGKKAKIVKAGASYSGVKLISSTTSEAEIEVAGVRRTLKLNGTTVLNSSLAAGPSKSSGLSVTLYESDVGFFESNGQINGRGVRFLVDTGANLVVFSSRDANRLGIEYLNGVKGFASTASGRSPMYSIEVDAISIGGISLNNIRAGVIEGGFPEIPLLGMSFLSRLDMNRSGKTMVLKKR